MTPEQIAQYSSSYRMHGSGPPSRTTIIRTLPKLLNDCLRALQGSEREGEFAVIARITRSPCGKDHRATVSIHQTPISVIEKSIAQQIRETKKKLKKLEAMKAKKRKPQSPAPEQ